MLATPAAGVVGILAKLRLLAEYLIPLDPADGGANAELVASLLADAERLAPEHWPEDYPPIPAA